MALIIEREMILINRCTKIILSMLLCSLLVALTACDSSPKSTVTILGGKENIKYATLNSDPKASLSDQTASPFSFAFEEENPSDIQYLKNGEEISIDFGSNPPDTLSISDGLLDSNGDYLYTSKLITDVPYVTKKGVYSFNLETNIASSLSSYYEQDKKEFRGFIINAFWEKQEKKYAFAIQSSAY
ncbi:hypothetical protein [Paenibacillus sp. FSL R7-0337]|uniref:hypothetical protein n=1 Tax=Paenibacillus sp. FSL R7-0337 TaxID=1926588 RepID=UPI00096EE41F|nr:hypothetical protein [Paenibacillus sp. FSL R7-0337]OMF89488.1 hypothetical protein BK147_25155 [Paenibacillus sp. FSL R7-0337]